MTRGTISSHQEIQLSEDSEDGPLYIFESCSFNSLSNSGNGGAITCSASFSDSYKPQLTIKQSTFKSCSSSSGYGGAAYINGPSSFIVEKTVFTDCNATYGYAGGLYFTSNRCLLLLSDSLFNSCHARMTCDSSKSIDDGGGFFISSSLPSTELHYIIQGCRFISCGCYDWGGGGCFGISSSVVGCANSLFSACKCGTAEAMGINLGTTDADFLIHFCYFSCNEDATYHTDVSINRYSGSFSSPFLHSFSIKPITKSVTTILNWTTSSSRNWFQKSGN